MEQKLPVVVGAVALLVVVGIWWQVQSPPQHEITVQEERHAAQADAVGVKTAAAPPRRMRESMRERRDAWMEARERQVANLPGNAAPDAATLANRRRVAPVPEAVEPQNEAGGEEEARAAAKAKRRHALDEEFEELRQTALSDPDPDERINALWSISVADEVGALPVLTAALRDGDREVRLAAVQELGGLEDERSVVDSLSTALADSDAEVRSEAVRLIGDTEDPRAARLARSMLNDSDPEVREEAQSVVESLDDEE